MAVGKKKLLPPQPVDRLVEPVVRFLEIEAASGIILLFCAVAALILANSAWSEVFADVWHTHAMIGIGAYTLDKPLELWINDGLMSLFFFVVGLEIKRELVAGELREWRKASLPIMGALGGMIVPAAIYLAFQKGEPGERGWGIPMATDIAFVVGLMTVLGPRVPYGLKVMLLSLAIVDDIGAIVVIALFYSSNISISYLALGGGGFLLTLVMNRAGVRPVSVYVLVGAAIWLAFLKSGIHPTIAGVLLGLLTPANALLSARYLTGFLKETHADLAVEDHELDRRQIAHELMLVSRESVSPLERLEHGLHTWVGFVIMPVFALANAGVRIQGGAIFEPVALSVMAGLVLGKPIGIVLFSWLAVKIGLARLPEGVNWPTMLGGGCLAGIGFTMSLFIGALAFDGPLLEAAKFGTLLGSLISAVLGAALLLMFLPGKPRTNA